LGVRNLSIQELLEESEHDLGLTLLAGRAGLGNQIVCPRIQKPGLAIAGYIEHFHPDRIQILGNTEISYLNAVDTTVGKAAVKQLCSLAVPCFILTSSLAPPDYFIEAADNAGIAVMKSELDTSTFISMISRCLEERSMPSTHMHGVMMDVLGVGVLLTGKSGVGKSECALDLVIRGHRLVADDVVFIKKKSATVLIGQARESIQHLMEIRGLGIINIKDLYGVSSIREKKVVDIILELVECDMGQDCDRLGIDEHTMDVLGVAVPHIVIPVRSGRNLSSIIEVAARNHLLKGMGYHSALDFHDRLLARMDSRLPIGEVE